LPIPIKTSCFSIEQEENIQKNILQYFAKYFNAKVELCHWSTISDSDIRGVEYLYDQIIFQEFYYSSFGLELDYKLVDSKVGLMALPLAP